MPFEETCRIEKRDYMPGDYDLGHWSVSQFCRRYGVSRDRFCGWLRGL
jgi:hypothetical protein